MKFFPPRPHLVSLGALGILTLSCVPPQPEVKDMLASRSDYSERNFSTGNISQPIQDQFSLEKKEFKKFSTFQIIYNCQVEKGENKSQVVYKWKNTVLQPGLFRTEIEYSNNDIPYAAYFGVKYLGLIALRWQNMYFENKYAPRIFEIKSIDSLTKGLAKPSPDSLYEYSGKSGTEVQIMNYYSQGTTFKTKQVMPAKQIHPILTGDAISMEVEFKNNNGVVSSKETKYYLYDYGLTIEVSGQDSGSKRTFTISNLEVK